MTQTVPATCRAFCRRHFGRFWLLAGALLGLFPAGQLGAKLSPLAPEPDWSLLDQFHGTMTRAEFTAALESRFAPGGAARGLIETGPDAALIRAGGGRVFRLEFASGSRRPAPRYWRTAAELGPAPPDKPLHGLRVTLDPGHLGGPWARMEERWFQIGQDKPVTEGDMNLLVARHLAARLRALGAEVSFTRTSSRPATSRRPRDLFGAARASLRERGITPRAERYSGPDDPRRPGSVQAEAEKLFYRTSEIRARARLVNTRLKPDLVLAIHFNAEAWGNPARPQLVDGSHLHLLVNGAFSASELAYDDIRRDMLIKLLNRSWQEEAAAAGPVAAALARATGLPPYTYRGGSVIRLSTYVWARNLLASRLFECPVVYLEPYVMNSRQDYRRIQMGDYDGVRLVSGVPRKSIYREYADAVATGLADYYRNARGVR